MARLNSFQRAAETIPNSIRPYCFRNNQEEEIDQVSTLNNSAYGFGQIA
jgi:hypothetical protein